MKRLMLLTTLASLSFVAAAQAQPRTILVPELNAQRRGSNEVVITGTIKNNWEVDVPSSGLLYVAQMYLGKVDGADKWQYLALGRAPALKVGQSHRFEMKGTLPASGNLIRVTVRGKLKETDTTFITLAFADFTLPALKPAEAVVPDLGVTSFFGVNKSASLGSGPVLFEPGKREFYVKVKNFGHQSALVDYKGGRTWKLYRLNGAKWELIASDKIAALKVGKERKIDLLQYLDNKTRGDLGAVVGASTFANKGTRWHFVISGGDANKDNDYKTLLFK